MRSFLLAAFVCAAPLIATPAFAQDPAAPARMAAQREAMKALGFLDGEWRGPAKTLTQQGWHEFTQTERVGPMLDGTVKVIEGRGYEPDGKIAFNAFAVISYDPDRKTYSMRSYSSGRQGDYAITPTATGFAWEIQAGPNMKIQYEATVKDGMWTEIGTRLPNGGQPVKFIEFSVTRAKDATWPAAGAVAPN